MATRIKIKGILSFPAVFKPKPTKDGDPRYGVNVLLDADDPQLEDIRVAIKEAATEKWGKKAATVLKQLQAQDRLCLHDGNLKDYAGYEGRMYISAASKTRPTVVDRRRNPVSEADGLIYAGAVGIVLLDIWAQDNDYGKRVNAGLAGVQFYSHGEPLAGGRPASTDEFDEFEEDVDEDETAQQDSHAADTDDDDDLPW